MLYSCSSLDDITQHPSSHVHWIEMKLTECFLYLLMFVFGVSSDMGIKLLKSPTLSLIITLCLFQYRKIILLKATKKFRLFFSCSFSQHADMLRIKNM